MTKIKVILTDTDGTVLDEFAVLPFKDYSRNDIELAWAVRDKLEFHFQVPEENDE